MTHYSEVNDITVVIEPGISSGLCSPLLHVSPPSLQSPGSVPELQRRAGDSRGSADEPEPANVGVSSSSFLCIPLLILAPPAESLTAL